MLRSRMAYDVLCEVGQPVLLTFTVAMWHLCYFACQNSTEQSTWVEHEQSTFFTHHSSIFMEFSVGIQLPVLSGIQSNENGSIRRNREILSL